MAKVQGIPLRSVKDLTAVPSGQPFDRKLALNDASAAEAESQAKQEEKPKEGGRFGGMLGRLKDAAAEASKMGDPKPDGPPKRGTLVTTTDEVKSITPGAVAASMFAPPAGYREVTREQSAQPE